MGVKVKIFDEEHDKDLEEAVNGFLKGVTSDCLIDIKYQLSHFSDGPGQIYSYSAMIIYKKKESQ
ncbi:MAG: sporulation protein Cse60 [Defluviitaleaceae bacterium]|nr:sporulation protein Cse60 [Defluviitaleaceae bacterium]